MDPRTSLFGRRDVSGGRPPPRPSGASPRPLPNNNLASCDSPGPYQHGQSGASILSNEPTMARRPGEAIPLQVHKLGGGSLQESYIFSNLCAVSPRDFTSRDGDDVYVLLKDKYVVTCRPTPNFPAGCISLSEPQRQWCGISMVDKFLGVQYDPFSKGRTVYMGAMDLDIDFASQKMVHSDPYDNDELAAFVIKVFQNQIFAPGQRFLMDHRGVKLALTVKTTQLVDMGVTAPPPDAPGLTDPRMRGILTILTKIDFYKTPSSAIKFKGSTRRAPPNAIIRADFKFEELGVGGLEAEFEKIFRRAFMSRLLPRGIAEQMGVPHVKGILLHGPPGTGKTLIARQLGKMLNCREPKVINGPEILNKYVGQSEENIRKTFADAEKEQKEKGEESGLHVIIFDELDAVCKQRGSGAGGGTGVGDNVVNQLLTKLDGVEQLNNILVIGMTNRMDLIDTALLRPGRFELHVLISLPDARGREQILSIHTRRLRESGRLEGDVDLNELAARTKNFSGSEIQGLVKAAVSNAISRHVKVGAVATLSETIQDATVFHQDFVRALDDIKPAFGVSEEELDEAAPHGIIEFGTHIKEIKESGRFFALTVSSEGEPALLSVLLWGPKGTGKTALAAEIARQSESDFPFIKMVSPAHLVGMSVSAKVEYLGRVFNDAYRSQISMVILDQIELLIEYVRLGPNYQASVLNAIATYLGRRPPKGKKLLIIGTTSHRHLLSQLGVLHFRREIEVPPVRNHGDLGNLLYSIDWFPSEEVNDALEELKRLRDGDTSVDVGVSDVLGTVRAAQARAQVNGEGVGTVFANELVRVMEMSSRE